MRVLELVRVAVAELAVREAELDVDAADDAARTSHLVRVDRVKRAQDVVQVDLLRRQDPMAQR